VREEQEGGLEKQSFLKNSGGGSRYLLDFLGLEIIRREKAIMGRRKDHETPLISDIYDGTLTVKKPHSE